MAPHDRQLVITADGRLAVLGPGDGFGHRFADELLFSAATAHGPTVIAVTLSGRLDGGARGVREVKRRGGRVLVQEPETAAATGMPNAALATGCVDFVLAPASLGHALLALCAAPGAADLFRVRLNPPLSSVENQRLPFRDSAQQLLTACGGDRSPPAQPLTGDGAPGGA